jgi:hypothetical protein
MADQLRDHPEKKVIVGNTTRIISGLNIILKALHEKIGLKQEEKCSKTLRSTFIYPEIKVRRQ